LFAYKVLALLFCVWSMSYGLDGLWFRCRVASSAPSIVAISRNVVLMLARSAAVSLELIFTSSETLPSFIIVLLRL
jgi:hypothetical protein